MKCTCEFCFAGPGGLRFCGAFITEDGQGGIVCPKCDKSYVNGKEVNLERKN